MFHVVWESSAPQEQLHSIEIPIITGPMERSSPLNTNTKIMLGLKSWMVEFRFALESYLLVLDVRVSIVLDKQSHAVDVAGIRRTL